MKTNEVEKMAGFSHTYIEEPYGWVRMEGCRLETREVSVCRPYSGYEKRQATMVVGTVADSSWCGALLCGVPVVKATKERYPVGSEFECEIRYQSDLVHGVTRRIAC